MSTAVHGSSVAVARPTIWRITDRGSFVARPEHPGWPPERYLVTLTCKGIVGVDRQGRPKFGSQHQVEIYLHAQYPQRWPGLKWLSPIWHPNINHLNGTVCIDAAWWTAVHP